MHKKRRQLYYPEVVDPSSKRFLNQCVLCGRVGLKPGALEIDYSAVENERTVDRHHKSAVFNKHWVIQYLQRNYEPLALDESGRCQVCSGVAENENM